MKRLFAFALTAIALLGWAVPARACSCVMPEPKGLLGQSQAAFVGTLSARRQAGETMHLVIFDVEGVYLGDIGPQAAVLTAAGGAACGIEAALGSRLAIFATSPDGVTLEGSLCATMGADEVIAQLGPPAPHAQTGSIGLPPEIASPSGPVDWQGVALAVGALVLVGGVWLVSRRTARAS